MFSLLVVVTAAATRPVFGELIIDPVHTVAKLDNVYAVILGALTFMIATVGINIVANFVSPAFDFSNVNPQKISWRMGGMIAAVGSVLITPWNLYNSPETIHYTLDTLGAFIGPLYGVLIADYYLVKKRRVNVDALYTLDAGGKYHYKRGYNPVAVVVTAISAIAGMIVVFFGSSEAATYTWFIGAGLAFALYMIGSRMFAAKGELPGHSARPRFSADRITARQTADAAGPDGPAAPAPLGLRRNSAATGAALPPQR